MKKGMIILIVVAIIGIILTIIIVSWQKRKTSTTEASINASLLQAQADVQAQNVQTMEDCKDNWLCALSSVTGGISNVVGAVT